MFFFTKNSRKFPLQAKNIFLVFFFVKIFHSQLITQITLTIASYCISSLLWNANFCKRSSDRCDNIHAEWLQDAARSTKGISEFESAKVVHGMLIVFCMPQYSNISSFRLAVVFLFALSHWFGLSFCINLLINLIHETCSGESELQRIGNQICFV